MKGRHASLMALLLATMVGGPAGAQHGPRGPKTSGPTGPIDVKVLSVASSGETTPLSGAEVVMERWISDRGRQASAEARASGLGVRLAGAAVAVSNDQGLVRFHPMRPGPGQMLAISVVHDGRTFGGEPLGQTTPGVPIEIKVYERTEDISRLRCDIFVALFVDEKSVVADVTVTLKNPDPVVVDVDRLGLRLPLLLPAVAGAPVEGILPDGALRNISTQRSPMRGRVRLSKGHVVYRGPILPGNKQQLRMRYAIPIVSSLQELGIQSVIPADRVRVLARWAQRIAPRLVPNRGFTAFERDQGEYRQRQIVLDDKLPAGTPLLLHFDRLPHSVSAEAAVALVGGLLLLALFGLALLLPAGTGPVPAAASGGKASRGKKTKKPKA